MNRALATAVALALLVGACGDSEAGTEPTGPAPTGGTSAATTTLPATAPSAATSTTAPAATTTATSAATTTTVAPPVTTATSIATTTTSPGGEVTTGPDFPSALPRDRIPWSEVGPGWYLALYATFSTTGGPEGPTVLYLVDGRGPLYEVAAWSSERAPFAIADRRMDGSGVLLYMTNFAADTVPVALVDVGSGETQILDAGPAGAMELGVDEISFTRPTGRNLVIRTTDGTTETLARYDTSGSLLATLFEQPDGGFLGRIEWLYGAAGTDVVVGHAAGVSLVANDGTLIRGLWSPPAHKCDPVRWWAEGVFLATCRGQGPAFPHDHYGELWLLRTDGVAGEPLTAIPPGEVIVVDFGYADAWPTSSGVRIQWFGDCSAASIDALNSDGTGTRLPNPGGEGFRMIDVSDERIAVHSWTSCGGEEGALYTSNADLGEVETLIPRLSGVMGVVDVVGLAAVYP